MKRKILALDLDNTLIYSMLKKEKKLEDELADFTFSFYRKEDKIDLKVISRPFVKEFLKEVNFVL